MIGLARLGGYVRLPGVLRDAWSGLDDVDVFFGVGLGLLAFGLLFVYWPAAFIVPGSILTGVGIVGSLRPAPAKEEEGD